MTAQYEVAAAPHQSLIALVIFGVHRQQLPAVVLELLALCGILIYHIYFNNSASAASDSYLIN